MSLKITQWVCCELFVRSPNELTIPWELQTHGKLTASSPCPQNEPLSDNSGKLSVSMMLAHTFTGLTLLLSFHQNSSSSLLSSNKPVFQTSNVRKLFLIKASDILRCQKQMKIDSFVVKLLSLRDLSSYASTCSLSKSQIDWKWYCLILIKQFNQTRELIKPFCDLAN